MRLLIVAPALVLAGLALGGCSTDAPMGVLPRDPVPPPPSVAGSPARPEAAPERRGAQTPRRGLSVPDRPVTPRPSPQG